MTKQKPTRRRESRTAHEKESGQFNVRTTQEDRERMAELTRHFGITKTMVFRMLLKEKYDSVMDDRKGWE